MGATPVTKVFTAGGGSSNEVRADVAEDEGKAGGRQSGESSLLRCCLWRCLARAGSSIRQVKGREGREHLASAAGGGSGQSGGGGNHCEKDSYVHRNLI
eukprot:587151-Hanusia_phi.AAC.2